MGCVLGRVGFRPFGEKKMPTKFYLLWFNGFWKFENEDFEIETRKKVGLIFQDTFTSFETL